MTDADLPPPDSGLPLPSHREESDPFTCVCSMCGKILGGPRKGQHADSITPRPDRTFSHGLCLSCARGLYPEFFARRPDLREE